MSKGRKSKHGATTRPLQGGSNSVGAEYERRGGGVDVQYGRSASLGQLGGETPPIRQYSHTDHYSGKVSLGQYGGEVPFWSSAYRGPPAYQGRDPMQGNYDELMYDSFDGGKRSYQDGQNRNPLLGVGSVTPSRTTNSNRARSKVNVTDKGWVTGKKDAWCADFKREVLQWMDLSCISWVSRNTADWQAVCNYIRSKYDYVGNDGHGVSGECLEFRGARILKNERWHLHQMWEKLGGVKSVVPPPSLIVHPQIEENGGHSPTKEEVRAEALNQQNNKGKEGVKASGALSTFIDLVNHLKSLESRVDYLTDLSEKILQTVGGVEMKKDEAVAGVASPFTAPGSGTGSVRQSKSSENTKMDIPIPPKSGEAHGQQSSGKIVGIASSGAGTCEPTSVRVAAKVLFPEPTGMEVKEAELGPEDGLEGGSTTSPLKRQSKRTPRKASGRPPKKKKAEDSEGSPAIGHASTYNEASSVEMKPKEMALKQVQLIGLMCWTLLFDRIVMVEPPDRQGREEILNVHVSKKQLPLAADVDLTVVAAATTGFRPGHMVDLVQREVKALLQSALEIALLVIRSNPTVLEGLGAQLEADEKVEGEVLQEWLNAIVAPMELVAFIKGESLPQYQSKLISSNSPIQNAQVACAMPAGVVQTAEVPTLTALELEAWGGGGGALSSMASD
ncbi:unnamed protein product [Calypogeia fissa]